MGIRCSQPQGLPDKAIEFLKNFAKTINQCPHCDRHDGYKRAIVGKYGMFDELNLHRYTLNDGSTVDEFIQHEIWDSGPMIWLGLKWKNTDFRWPNEAIQGMDDDSELADYGMSQEASYYEDVRRKNESHE